MKIHLSFRFGHQFSIVIALLLVVIFDAVSQEQVIKSDVESYPPVSIKNAEIRTFYSDILNREMNIYIKLPAGYYDNTDQVYQALYFTDANRQFHVLADIAGLSEFPRPAEPEIVIVGIGYKIRDMGDWGEWRSRDLTPTNVPASDSSYSKQYSAFFKRQFEVRTGGAPLFLKFINEELFPFIEANYRVSVTERGLGGYSLGGLFSLYVLLTQPELFTIYFAGSPSIGYDKGVLFRLEEEYASINTDIKAKLLMTFGGLEDTTNMKKMAQVLLSRNYPGLSVTTHVFPGENHQSCFPSAIMKALRVLYKR